MTASKNLFKENSPQILATMLGTLMAVSDGMTYGWTSPMIPYFTGNSSHLPVMTEQEAQFMETINLLGTGLPIVFYLVNQIGRKKCMLVASFLAALCWITIIFAPNKEALYAARFFAGMASDICFVAAPMYIAEIAHHRIRGFLSASVYLMMLIGILIVYTIGSYTPYYVPPILGIILTVSQCIFFPFMPESPYFYIYNDRFKEAKEALLQLRKNKSNIDTELKEMKDSVRRQKTEKGRLRDLFLEKTNRLGLIIMIVLNLGQNYSGITIIVMNLHSILSEAGDTYIDPSIAAIMFALIMLIGGLTASLVIDKVGRKYLLIMSGIGTGLVLSSITIYFQLKHNGFNVHSISWIPAVACMIYAATFKLGLGLVPIVLTAEIFPTTVKALGMTIADIWYIFGAVTSVNVYSWLSLSYGIHIPFYILACSSFSIVIFTSLFVPETKGKTLDEIQRVLKGQ